MSTETLTAVALKNTYIYVCRKYICVCMYLHIYIYTYMPCIYKSRSTAPVKPYTDTKTWRTSKTLTGPHLWGLGLRRPGTWSRRRRLGDFDPSLPVGYRLASIKGPCCAFVYTYTPIYIYTYIYICMRLCRYTCMCKVDVFVCVYTYIDRHDVCTYAGMAVRSHSAVGISV